MASGQELAVQLLPHFAKNVVARSQMTYGYYARAIGRNSAKESLSIGPAMHSIGAVCVIQEIPVAPLYWVRRESGEPRQVFTSDALESRDILGLGRFETMFVVAREYQYSSSDFEKIRETMEALIAEAPKNWTPHFLWHYAIVNKPEGEDRTYLERAFTRYETLLADFKAKRAHAKG